MPRSAAPLGDTHNFGRSVAFRDGRVHKPRTIVWEQLLLGMDSPLRRLLDDAAERDGLGPEAFGFLPRLQFSPSPTEPGGEVERVTLEPLPDLSAAGRGDLATIVGRAIALFSWLGVADLHWENLVLGADARGRTIFGPLDVEMILDDLSLPTHTQLLPDADPEVAEFCRHASGVRRVLPFLGKPVHPGDLLAMAAAYVGTLALLDRRSAEIASVFKALPHLQETPIRVCLRGTDEYVRARAALAPLEDAASGPGPRKRKGARAEALWPPLLEGETEQLARGDIPYFFRLLGQPGIHYYADPTLARLARLPMEGDVPQLEPLLSIERGLRSRSRKSLREEGLFALLGAFDHKSFAGRHEHGGLAVTFQKRTLVATLPGGEELTSRRDLRAFVGSVYLPCRCGEVRSVFVPQVTTCEMGPAD